MRKYVLALLTITLLFSSTLYSENPLEKIRLNGFLSQSFMKSHNNNFLVRSLKGSFDINELGVTVSTNMTDRLRFGFQLFSRNLGEVGKHNVVMDWAFGDYRISNELGIRLGKVKAPFGLYNEGRDTDFLRPMALLPQGTYNDAYRGFINAYQGLGIYGNIYLGSAGDLAYHGYVGTVSLSKDETLVKHLQSVLNMLAPVTGIVLTDMSVTNRVVTGGKVEWNTPLTGLKTAFTGLYFNTEFHEGTGGPKLGYLKVPLWWLASLEYQWKNLTLASEYGQMQSRIGAFDLPFELEHQTNQSFYVMLSYMLTPKLTLTGLMDIFYENKKDKEGLTYEAQGLPRFMGWRKDYGGCLRYEINPHWMVKGEFHYVNGTALYMHLYNLPQNLLQKWNYFILKTSFSF